MSYSLKLLTRYCTRNLLNACIIRNTHKIKTNYFNKHIGSTCGISYVHFSKSYSNLPTLKCWKCGIERKHIVELFCEKCRSIQNPSQTSNYFKLFGLDEAFSIDQKVLTQKYREMQSVLHPDRFSNRSDEEKKISDEFSSLVNKAYNVLQSPLSRALHMLTLYGEQIDEDQKVSDPDFLVEIMELNEEVESASTPVQLKELNKKNKLMLDTLAGNINNCFSSGDIQGAKNQIIKMKYYTSISKHVNSILRERGIVE